MTVTYSDASFKKLLFRWRGSIWKSIWRELAVFLAAYAAINVAYRTAMTPEQKEQFEGVVHFVNQWTGNIPIQFLLGFFVNYIVSRWWDQLMNIAWPDKFLLFVTANFPGSDRESRLIRRNIARWVNLHAVLVWREVCIKVKRRFPTNDHLVKAGLMSQQELDIFDATTPTHGKWFVPVSWIVNLLAKSKKENLISDIALQQLVSELYAFRGANGMLTVYDWINAPLRYTQVATVATYLYFLVCLIGRQAVAKSHDGTQIDIYVPIITIMEFIFYVGWLKVAEEYKCPFGDDDDDFDMNYIVDRDIHVSNMLVDELVYQNPELIEDKFWETKYPVLPHTVGSYNLKDKIPNWRLAKQIIHDDEMELLPEHDHNAEPLPPGYHIGRRGVVLKGEPKKRRGKEKASEEIALTANA